jgi:two-component system cell cycle response regulator DivK
VNELILIVEDNDRNLKLVRDLLRVKGFDTAEARDATCGLALAAERRPALILMDIQLPDLDGVSALRRLRSDSRTMSIPVVAVTAFAMSSDRERLLEAGFDGYVQKPIDVTTFPAQVGAMLRPRVREDGR